MNQEEQSKKTSQVITDAAVKEVIPAKPTGELSEKELDKVAGGVTVELQGSNLNKTHSYKGTVTLVK